MHRYLWIKRGPCVGKWVSEKIWWVVIELLLPLKIFKLIQFIKMKQILSCLYPDIYMQWVG